MDAEEQTIGHYDGNAASFIAGTANVEFDALQQKFSSILPKGGHVLGLSCGSDRDSLTFLKAGFKVDAMDGSAAMAKAVGKFTGLPAIIAKYVDTLKPGGVFYLSFKVGPHNSMRNGRRFTDLDAPAFRTLIAKVVALKITRLEITPTPAPAEPPRNGSTPGV